HPPSLAAAAIVDLRLDDPQVICPGRRRFATTPGEGLRRAHRLGDGETCDAFRRRDSVLPQDLLSLILVDVHRFLSPLPSCRWERAASAAPWRTRRPARASAPSPSRSRA